MSGRIVCVLFLCAISQLASCTQTATYTCYDNHLYFKLELSDGETLVNIYTSDPDKVVSCDITTSTLITGTGTNADPYYLDLDLSTFSAPDPKCGATGADASVVSLTLYTQGLANAHVYTFTDQRYDITCDVTTAGTVNYASLDASAITGDPATGVVTTATETLTLTLRDDLDNIITAAVIGDDVKLQVDIVKPTAFAFGIRVTECVARLADNEPTDEQTLLDTNGCIDTSGPLKEFPGSQFIGSSPASSDPGYLAISGTTFKMFRFTDQETMFIECTVIFCMTSGDAQCNADHCVPARRRKRDALNTTTTSLNINVYASEAARDAQSRLDVAACQQVTHTQTLAYGSVIGVMALVLLVMLFLLAFLFMRRTKRSRKDDNISYVTSNPGFQK